MEGHVTQHPGNVIAQRGGLEETVVKNVLLDGMASTV